MSIQITAVHYAGNQKTHPAIASYRWTGRESNDTGTSDKHTLVTWIDGGGAAYVSDGRRLVTVATVHPQSEQPYLRTHADGIWTDNLLALPTF